MDISSITSIFNQAWTTIINFLPGSPFRALVDSFKNLPYMRYLNWFIPIKEMLAVVEAWIAAVAIFYIYQAILRFIKLL